MYPAAFACGSGFVAAGGGALVRLTAYRYPYILLQKKEIVMTNLLEQTIHIKTPISRDALDSVIVGLEAACGGNQIVVTEAYDLIVNDQRQIAALKALFASVPAERFIRTRGPNKSKPALTVQPAIVRNPIRAWCVLDILGQVVEHISIEEKNRRLAAGEFEPNTILHHPKAGRQRVTGAKGQPQGLEPS
jgi:hypothetical protein